MFERTKTFFGRIFSLLTKRPAVTFFALLIALFGLIALSHYLRTPESLGEMPQAENKATLLFIPNTDTPYIDFPAQVKKENVMHVVALAPGIVGAVRVKTGQLVGAGQTLVELTNDYQSQKTEIEKGIAKRNADLTEELARIDKKIFDLEEKKTKNDDSLSDREEDIALAELKKERATRKTTLENNPLQLELANLSDAVLKPKTFVSGTIESIRVQSGDFVNAGDTLLTLRATRGTTTLEALVSREVADLFDPTKSAKLKLDTENISLLPTFYSRTENENGLYSILFTLSESVKNKITDGEYVSIALPLKASVSENRLVPIDAVFQDTTGATVLTEESSVAVNHPIILGHMYGSFVEVTGGLAPDAHVILSRSVIAGDTVTVLEQ